MGISLEFYAGNAEAIGADFDAMKFDDLRNGKQAAAYVDFSLHLSPTDLDILSEVIAERVGVDPLELNDCLIETVGGDGTNFGAELVDPAWVRMIAAADDAESGELAETWIEQVGDDCGQQLEVTPDAVRVVGELIRLCRLAERNHLAVVHTWSL